MAFAHLVLSGTMTDRQAAEAVGRNPTPPTLSETKVGLAFPILRPARRQTRLRTLALTLTAASSSSPAPFAPRKRSRQRLMPPCPLLLQTTGSLPLSKRPLYLAPETPKETHALPMPQNIKKDRILSNFTKSNSTEAQWRDLQSLLGNVFRQS
jgi:hypothetical protein